MITLFVFLLTMVPTPTEHPGAAPDRLVPRHACSAVSVRSPGTPVPNRRPAWRARDVVDLELSTRVRPSSREAARIEFRVYTPAGHLYETFPASITQGSATAKLPVSGTAISQRGLYGQWKVVPHFEGDLAPCAQARTFSLTP
jgi:hypothetical protein